MQSFPGTLAVSTKTLVDEINNLLDSKNYFSALFMALTIPDICSKYIKGFNYIKWFDKYVYSNFYDYPVNVKEKRKIHDVKFDGIACYALRNAVLHSGTSHIKYKEKYEKLKKTDTIELAINKDSDRYSQYCESRSITTINGIETSSIRINIAQLTNNILFGYQDFLDEHGISEIPLFYMIDGDSDASDIVFTPSE